MLMQGSETVHHWIRDGRANEGWRRAHTHTFSERSGLVQAPLAVSGINQYKEERRLEILSIWMVNSKKSWIRYTPNTLCKHRAHTTFPGSFFFFFKWWLKSKKINKRKSAQQLEIAQHPLVLPLKQTGSRCVCVCWSVVFPCVVLVGFIFDLTLNRHSIDELQSPIQLWISNLFPLSLASSFPFWFESIFQRTLLICFNKKNA